ncbi:hypothetical protein A2U01_0053382, partial [Trifolium medium]|nr:hypothetical protein [Trifolium medium]
DKTPSKSTSSSAPTVEKDSSRTLEISPETHVKKTGSPLSVIAEEVSPDSTIKKVVSELSHQFQTQDTDKSSPEKEAKEDKEEEKGPKQVSPPRVEVVDSNPLKEAQAIETLPAQESKEEHTLPTP